ncbi:MAG: thioredoxin [Elusimicrobia bacterium]|nr:thioredoxin [Elusimicrobiota bacterium]
MGIPVPSRVIFRGVPRAPRGESSGVRAHPKRRRRKMNHIELTDESFEREVLADGGPTVVDFWAPWCGPCRMLAPVVEELAEEYAGRVKVAKMNTDENPGVATALGISAIPTLLFFKDGKLVDRAMGAAPKAALKRRIEAML